MGNKLKGLIYWCGSAVSWVVEKTWGDQVFARIKPMIPAEWTSLETALRFVWEFGVPAALVAAGIYFFLRKEPLPSAAPPAVLAHQPFPTPIDAPPQLARAGDVILGPGTYRAGDGGSGGKGGDFIVKGGDAINFAPSPLLSGPLPLQEAARKVYEALEGSKFDSWVDGAFDGKPPEDKLNYVARLILSKSDPPAEVSGAKRPSTISRIIPFEDREHMRLIEGRNELGKTAENHPTFTNVSVTEAELNRLIEYYKNLSEGLP